MSRFLKSAIRCCIFESIAESVPACSRRFQPRIGAIFAPKQDNNSPIDRSPRPATLYLNPAIHKSLHMRASRKPLRSGSKRFRQGFTLLELLIVVSILGILVGLLLPALNKARDKAHAVQCLNNTRQLQLAWLMYSDDFDGSLPPSKEHKGETPWVEGIFPEARTIPTNSF
jgi:prepilin-type N-terminal cleavage/methylation domain-containing protein